MINVIKKVSIGISSYPKVGPMLRRRIGKNSKSGFSVYEDPTKVPLLLIGHEIDLAKWVCIIINGQLDQHDTYNYIFFLISYIRYESQGI